MADKIDDEDQAPEDVTEEVQAEIINDAPTEHSQGLADTDIVGWFARRGLVWTDEISVSLADFGVMCVEQLKLLPKDDFLGMFAKEKFIAQQTAKIVYDELHSTPLDITKCAIPVVESAAARFRKTQKRVAAKKAPVKRQLLSAKNNKKDRKSRNRGPVPKQSDSSDPLLESIIRLWNTEGHQNNLLRLSVCNALREGHTKAVIARVIRSECYGESNPWDGVGKDDSIFKKTKAVLLRIHNDWKNGKLDSFIESSGAEQHAALMSKSVRPGARGRVKGAWTSSKKSSKKEEGDIKMENQEGESYNEHDQQEELGDASSLPIDDTE